MAKEVNRKFDTGSFAAIADKVLETGHLRLILTDKGAANAIRFQFYMWRKQEQELGSSVSALADIIVRIDGNVLTFERNFANADLRIALATAGVTVLDDMDAILDAESEV